MTHSDRPAFAQFLLALGTVFDQTVGSDQVELYFAALQDLPITDLQAAVQAHIRSGRFFPRPVELREWIEGGTPDDSALRAWMWLCDAIPTVGRYSAVFARDAAWVEAICRVFGSWPGAVAARDADEGGWVAKRREFLLAYRDAVRTLPTPTRLAYLPGQHDLDNRLTFPEPRVQWVWVLDAGRLQTFTAPYRDGLPVIDAIEDRLRALPAPPRVMLPPVPDVEPTTREQYLASREAVLRRFAWPTGRRRYEPGETNTRAQVRFWKADHPGEYEHIAAPLAEESQEEPS